MYNGILIIKKEQGYTSHDVVAKLRGILKQKKIGHTGTLDPDATGVLPVCLGSGTKLCDMLTDHSKEYVAEFLLGVTTDTQDITGTILTESPVEVSAEEAAKVVYEFVGDYEQIPPMYSALKVNGRKLCDLARAGQVIERKARSVKIGSIEILDSNLPRITLRVSCSKGTYIRTLGFDIGEKLGCGATMTRLVRTRVGTYTLRQAITLGEVQTLRDRELLEEKIIPVDTVFEHLQKGVILPEFRKFLENGNTLFPHQLQEEVITKQGEQIRIYNEEQVFCGIYGYQKEKQGFVPIKLFLGRDS